MSKGIQIMYEGNIKKEGDSIDYSLTPMQDGLLFHNLSQPLSETYIVKYVVDIACNIHFPALEDAWNFVLEKHPMLRAVFKKEQSYYIEKASPPFIKYIDKTKKSSEGCNSLNTKLSSTVSLNKKLPLLLIKLEDKKFQLIWTHHHIFLDGWSVRLVLEDLFDFYKQKVEDSFFSLRPSVPFYKYVDWIKEQDMEEAQHFWKNKLDFPPSFLIKNFKSFEEDTEEQHSIQFLLTAEKTKSLQSFAKDCGVSFSTLIQAAWAILLGYLSGEKEVVYGMTLSGRSAPIDNIEHMVGLLINTLPLKITLPSCQTIKELLRNIQLQTAQISDFIYTPLSQIKAWNGGKEIFDHIMVIENYPPCSFEEEKNETLNIRSLKSYEKTDYPLTIVVNPQPKLRVEFVYKKNKFKEKNLDFILNKFQKILTQFKSTEQPLSSFSILEKKEEDDILSTLNRLDTTIAKSSIYSLVSQHIKNFPENPAIIYFNQIISYRELDEKVESLALVLSQWRGSVVAVHLSPSPDFIVIVLALLRSGCIYMPIDVFLPKSRIIVSLRKTKAQLIISESLFFLDDEFTSKTVNQIKKMNTNESIDRIYLEEPAYIICTSGSTGDPKHILVQHSSLLNHLLALQKEHKLTSLDSILFHTSIGFDVSLRELLWPLISGACIVIAPSNDIDEIFSVIKKNNVTILDVTPSLLDAYLCREDFEELPVKTTFVGGEVLKGEIAKRFYESGTKSFLYNVYGPTEATIDTTFYLCPHQEKYPLIMPIGRPYMNKELYVLDSYNRSVLPGMEGELHIGGKTLARGYYEDEFSTKSKFYESNISKTRIYKTGDIVRFKEDGELEFIRRDDTQVKLRGVRIELEEIIGELDNHPNIKRSEVIFHENDIMGQFLVGYIIAQPPLSKENLRVYLKKKLPLSMVPSYFVFLSHFPTTLNGKTDVNSLKKSFQTEIYSKEDAINKPCTDLEKTFSSVFEEILSVKSLDVTKNFFDIGVHSLLLIKASQMILEKSGRKIELIDFFKYPTIRLLALSQDYNSAKTEISLQKRQKALNNFKRIKS